MSCDSILDPKMKLVENDEYYLFYEMLVQSLKTDNVIEGINNSLKLLRHSLSSGNVVLYKKNGNNNYVYKDSDTPMDELISKYSCIVNKTAVLTESKGIFNLNMKVSDRINNICMLHTATDETDWILFINNCEKYNQLDQNFWKMLKDTIQIIIKRAISYDRNTKAISMDLLTGLDNRNSYENQIQSFDESSENVTVGVFDLFRLKNINDEYGHEVGDRYIKAASKILSKYWPKYKITILDDGSEFYKVTGHNLYRYGGDEFVLITDENIDLTQIKAKIVSQEASMIDLGLKLDDLEAEKPILGINFGISSHIPGDTYKNTFSYADSIMQSDKLNMYKATGLERRR